MFLSILNDVLTILGFVFWSCFAVYGYVSFLKKLTKDEQKNDYFNCCSGCFLFEKFLSDFNKVENKRRQHAYQFWQAQFEEDGSIPLSDTQRAFRSGYLSAQKDSANAWKAKQKKK